MSQELCRIFYHSVDLKKINFIQKPQNGQFKSDSGHLKKENLVNRIKRPKLSISDVS